jgi:hypothetical protein
MNIRCWNELATYGAVDVLRREYGSLLKDQPEPEFNVTLEIDLEQIPTDKGMYVCDLLDIVHNHPSRVSRRVHQVHLAAQAQCTGGSVRAGIQGTEISRERRLGTGGADGSSLSRRGGYLHSGRS